jgi:hypothetical protein
MASFLVKENNLGNFCANTPLAHKSSQKVTDDPLPREHLAVTSIKDI